MNPAPIVEIQNLGITFSIPEALRAIDSVNLAFSRGKITAVIGESGCGKSTLANSILGIFPSNAVLDPESRIIFDGGNLLELDREALRQFRWRKASMVFQSAQSSLNPTLPIGEQLLDSILDHDSGSQDEAKRKIIKLLEMVNLDASRILDSYPHQVSGGMKQRIIIAMALTLDPELILLDEPTTALDVITQHYIFDILADIHKKLDLTMILITHDIELAVKFADTIVVMYGGEVFEVVPAAKIKKPAHPYTEGLLNSIPRLSGEEVEIKAIPGHPPDLINKPTGCIFRPRCQMAKKICEETKPKLTEIKGPGSGNHLEIWAASCHFARERVA